jgi:hypothetical protein
MQLIAHPSHIAWAEDAEEHRTAVGAASSPQDTHESMMMMVMPNKEEKTDG